MVPSAAARLRHAGSILDPIRRVSHHQVRLDAAEDALDVRRDRAVAAEETMPPEQPQIARLRHRVLGSRAGASSGSVSPAVRSASRSFSSRSPNPVSDKSKPPSGSVDKF